MGEARFDRLLERRHHARVVGGDSLFERVQPTVVLEDVEIGVGQDLDVLLGDGADARTFVGIRQAQSRCDTCVDGVITGRAAEDEEDRGQEVVV